MNQLTLDPNVRQIMERGIALGKARRKASLALAQTVLAQPERYPELLEMAQAVIEPETEVAA